MIVRETLDNGVRLLTETMSQVRSVSLGVWLTRGSRDESDAQSGIAHFVEHMLFKGTPTRTAEDIAQAIDSIGGQLDAFTAKEYSSYYVKVLRDSRPLSEARAHPAPPRRRLRTLRNPDPLARRQTAPPAVWAMNDL